MKSLSLAIAFCIALISSLVNAQVTDTSQRKTITIYQEVKPEKKGRELPKNCIKINPAIVLAGEMQLFYERSLSKQFSVELGLGMTLDPLVLNQRAVFGVDINGDYVDVEADYQAGPDFKLGIKFFPGNKPKGPKGFYSQYQVGFKRYNYDSFGFDSISGASVRTAEKYSTYTQMVDYGRFTLGYNDYLESNFYYNVFVGVGIRNRNMFYIERGSSYDLSGGYYYTIPVTENKTVPVFIAGVQVGFGF